MRARVKANSPIASVRACVGRDFTRGGWTELPDSFLQEAGDHPYLEVEQVTLVEPDESIEAEPAEQVQPDEPVKPESDEPVDPPPPNFDVVLAGNATAVKGLVSSLNSKPDLEEMKQAESSGKARKGVLDAIDDRLTEVEDSK